MSRLSRLGWEPRGSHRAIHGDSGEPLDHVKVSQLNNGLLSLLFGGTAGLERFSRRVGAPIEYTIQRPWTRTQWQIRFSGRRRQQAARVVSSVHAGWGARGLRQLVRGNAPDSLVTTLGGSLLLTDRRSSSLVGTLEALRLGETDAICYPNSETIYGSLGSDDIRKVASDPCVKDVLFQLKPKMAGLKTDVDRPSELPNKSDSSSMWRIANRANPITTARDIMREARREGFTGICFDVHHTRSWLAALRGTLPGTEGFDYDAERDYMARFAEELAAAGFVKSIHIGVGRLIDDGIRPAESVRANLRALAAAETSSIKAGKIADTFVGSALNAIHAGIKRYNVTKVEGALDYPSPVIEYPAPPAWQFIPGGARKIVAANREIAVPVNDFVRQLPAR